MEEIQKKKVTVIGHFPAIEERLGTHCQLSILERSPLPGDYPDSACEYLLPEQDYVFVTGCTFVNKTFPRLLSLAQKAKLIIVGPSTPLAPVLFHHGVYGLSGFVATPSAPQEACHNPADPMGLFRNGLMVDQIRPENI